MYIKGVVLVPGSKTLSHEFDLNVMKILINVYVQRLAGNMAVQVLTGLFQAWGELTLSSTLCHL